MEILLVNDDGINALGLKLLAKRLLKYGNVTVLAPDGERSASSHSINIKKPLTIEEVEPIVVGVKCYQTNGTPADCVRLATGALGREFEIVFSGVNYGLNIGTDVIYSGTCAGAREAFIEGIPSVAISCDRRFDIVENEIDNLLDLIFYKKIYSKDYSLNINFPVHDFEKSKGIKFVKMGKKRFKTTYMKNDEGLYVVLKDEILYDIDPLTDAYLSLNGYTTITVLDANLSKEIDLDLFNSKL
ncbi:MAG: 5'/3'-nucleotidase SurE [Acholeplasmatales bacterium]|nr:5'/3'-nucleotidase SurE [Acholeplasmatales bacterium]